MKIEYKIQRSSNNDIKIYLTTQGNDRCLQILTFTKMLCYCAKQALCNRTLTEIPDFAKSSEKYRLASQNEFKILPIIAQLQDISLLVHQNSTALENIGCSTN